MCGICGVVHTNFDQRVEENQIRRMTDAIVHRGPDDEGIYVKPEVGLGMRRLSIIDLVTGKQPISNESGDVWIVFNGEIYNHHELRKELIARGHRFATKTDTESIVHAYEEYGEQCVEKLNGMFAFAIWDERKKSLFVARDRIGIKPLYYFFDKKRFIFGSEIKSILQAGEVPRRIDLQALDNFLTFEYIPAPLSIFQDIRKLPPGQTLTLKANEVYLRSYWNLRMNSDGFDSQKTEEKLVEVLQDAVKIRLMSDVPLGAFLSGGIDSSTIVALMAQVMNQPVKTFSIGFEDQTYNELNYARMIAKKYQTEHFESIIQPNALELMESLIHFLDEPFGDFSIFPTYLVSKMAREHVTVVLSGDGGDELFGGYDTYLAHQIANKYAKLPGWLRKGMIRPIVDSLPPSPKKKGLINRAKRFVEGTKLSPELQHTRWMIFLQDAEREMLYTPEMKSGMTNSSSYQFILDYFEQVTAQTRDEINQQMYVDVKTYLVDDILVKVDRMSMATSLEARVPLLDHRVVELAASIPGNAKLQGKKSKVILKDAMKKYLPEEILYRGKEGFSIPIKNWIKNELKPMMLDLLNSDRIKAEGFFDYRFVERLISEHLSGKENHSHRLWALMMFEKWSDLYMK
ncbi:asparagine synthase (glutamine-hydrolyzing) [candidate division KSB1 bacterium 4484_87]|nr:MAG: asparagine synthase (glutamine-hydrolyzing) [candidate division KSB1 bacterium 4484_87]